MVAEILQTLEYAEKTNDWDELKSVIFEWKEIALSSDELDDPEIILSLNPFQFLNLIDLCDRQFL